ncbi:hypothetical protein [Qipengyuania flava]|uniref:hypothetical protein n=1 Tax=Qipengyuania flava TaxID=192812 RepID=UPI003C7CFA64
MLTAAQFGQHGFHIGQRASHPFELRIGKALALERIAHGMIGNDRTVIGFAGLVEFDGVICNCCRL